MSTLDNREEGNGGLQRGKNLFEVPQGSIQHSGHGLDPLDTTIELSSNRKGNKKSIVVPHQGDQTQLRHGSSHRQSDALFGGADANNNPPRDFPVDRSIAELMKKCAFRTGYYYSRGMAPGIEMFKYIAKSHGSRRPLRMWIPDTIVHGLESEGAPFWLYCNKNGVVKCKRRFNQQQMLERIGSRRYEDDLVAVAKEPIYSTVRRNQLQYDGNNSTVVSTRSLKQMVSDKASVSGSPLVIQRYIKSKGSKACIVRACFRLGKPSEMWQLSNVDRFNSTKVDGKGTPADSFILNDSQQGSLIVYSLRRQAKVEYEIQNKELVSYLESVIKRRISELVVDYLKDDFNQIWFLKVKAYRFHDEQLPRGVAMGNFNAEEGLDTNGSEDDSPMLSSTGRVGQSRRTFRQGHSGLFNRKCRFCSMVYPLESLRFKMTTQMILDTAGHLRSRVSRTRYQKLLASQAGGDLGLDASRLYHAHKVCRTCFELYHHEKELKAVEAMFARALGLPIPLQPMLDTSDDMLKCVESPPMMSPKGKSDLTCSRGGSMIGTARGRKSQGSKTMLSVPSSHSIMLSPLNSASEKLSMALSNINSIAAGTGKGKLMAQNQSRLSQSSPTHANQVSLDGNGSRISGVIQGVLKRAFRDTSGNKSIYGGDEYGQQQQQESFSNASSGNPMHDVAASMPQEVTLCRFLIAVHEIHDLPRRLVDELEQQPNTCLILRFSVLNKEYDVPVNLSLCKFSHYRNRTTSVLPLHYFRVYACFSPDTPVKGTLPEHSGIATYLETQKHIQLRLLKGQRGSWTELGAGSIPLAQFKSDYVKSVEQYVPLGLSLELCSVKVTVGVERTRSKVDSGILSNIKFHRGLYVPHSHYYTGDPLPREWMTALQITHHEHREITQLDFSSDSATVQYHDKPVDASSDDTSSDYGDEFAEKSSCNRQSSAGIVLKSEADQVTSMGVKYVNPLSPVKAVALPRNRRESTLYQRLQSEVDEEQRRGIHGNVPSLLRSPSFTATSLSRQGSFFSTTSARDDDDTKGVSTKGKKGLLKTRSSADVSGERRSMASTRGNTLMPIHDEEVTTPASESTASNTKSSPSSVASHLNVGPAMSDPGSEKELWCIRVNIEAAKNLYLPPELYKLKRWHAIYELFGRKYRSCVSSLENHTTLNLHYSKKHYVWATKHGLHNFFAKFRNLTVSLAHSMPLVESSRMEDLDTVFRRVDVDCSGCVTRKQLAEALELIDEQLAQGISPNSSVVTKEAFVARELNQGSPGCQPRTGLTPPTRKASSADDWHLVKLGALLREYWSQGAIGSGALLEACTFKEFVDISLLILRLHNWYEELASSEGGCEKHRILESVKAEAVHLFYPIHEPSREDHTVLRDATCHKDSFIQLIELWDGQEETTSPGQVSDADEENKKQDVSENTTLSWKDIVDVLHQSINGSKSCTYPGTARAGKQVCLFEEDQVSLSCSVPLETLSLGGDAVDNTFDLQPVDGDGSISCNLSSSKESIASVIHAMKSFCSQMKQELGSGALPLPRVRDWMLQNIPESQTGFGDILQFLNQFKGGGRVKSSFSKNKSSKAQNSFKNRRPSDGVLDPTESKESNEYGEYHDDDWEAALSGESVEITKHRRGTTTPLEESKLTSSSNDSPEEDYDYLSSSEDGGMNESSGDFSEDFKNDATSVGARSTGVAVEESKKQVRDRLPNGKRHSSAGAEDDLVVIVAANTLAREFELFYNSKKGVNSTALGTISYPAYMQISLWVYGTDTNGSMLSPTKYSLTKLTDSGEVMNNRK